MDPTLAGPPPASRGKFTPTYSSWHCLDLHVDRHRDDDPKPYIWHKTPDEILGTLATPCRGINDSDH